MSATDNVIDFKVDTYQPNRSTAIGGLILIHLFGVAPTFAVAGCCITLLGVAFIFLNACLVFTLAEQSFSLGVILPHLPISKRFPRFCLV